MGPMICAAHSCVQSDSMQSEMPDVQSAAQVSPDRFADIKSALVSICSSSTRSMKPAIYGIAAEAEIKLLRPLASIEV